MTLHPKTPPAVVALLVLGLGLVGRLAYGNDPGLVLESLGGERGLDIESVTALHQDRAGFIWIGTRDGLILYDGYSVTVFEHGVADASSISDNLVRTIYEDRRGNLWIGTNSGGLNRLDRATWTFEHFRHDSGDPQTISHDSVNVILDGPDGGLWVGTQIGLNRLDIDAGTFERFLAPTAITHDYVYALLDSGDGGLWVGTIGGGLDLLRPGRGVVETFRHDPADPASLPDDEVLALARAPDGALWVGSEHGVSRRDPGSGAFRSIPFTTGRRGEHNGYLVTSLAVDAAGSIWIGTWRDGLLRCDVAGGDGPAVRASLAPGVEDDTRVVSLLVDRAGSLWVGTWDAGLLRSGRGPAGVLTLGTERGLGFEDATAVLEGTAGRLWVGTWGEGLSVSDPREAETERRFERVPVLPVGSVLSLEQDSSGGIWAGTMSGLWRIGPGSDQRRFEHDPRDARSLGRGYVTSILEDHQGRVWVGVGGSGLHRVTDDGTGFERFVNDPADPSTLSDDYITVLAEDSEGVLWIGTRSGGLNELRPGKHGFERYLPDPDDPTTLSHHYVTAIHESPGGGIWVTTAGGGLNLGERGSDGRMRFRRFGEAEGLVDSNVRALAADDDGTLWLATAHGLSRFQPGTETFVNYGVGDGLPVTGFNTGSAHAGRKRLYFGTTHGVLSIARGTPFEAPAPAPTLLRSIMTLDRTIVGPRPAWELERLEVPWGEVLTFQFAVLDFSEVERHRYAYRLLGLRDEWIDIGPRRDVTFTDLDPGRYTLSVRGRNARGVWSDSRVSLLLEVVPPFWMTPWFRVVALVLIAGVALGGHKVRTSRLERRNRELLALKEQRERALAEAHSSQDRLNEAYGRLRSLTRRLELAKEDERKRIARELHDEMGQALTAAKINLQLMLVEETPGNFISRVEDTIELVDRMIGHVRALSLDLRPPLLDELGLAAALRSYLEALAQRSGLDIRVSTDSAPARLAPEIEITAFRVIQEAVTNVMRHAEASTVDVRVAREEDALVLSVADDGRGFEVDTTLERAAGGRHLGLLGIRERVESLGGIVDLRSAPGQGTAVCVRVPLPGQGS